MARCGNRLDIGEEVCLHKRSLLPTSQQHLRSRMVTAVRIFEYLRSSLRWWVNIGLGEDIRAQGWNIEIKSPRELGNWRMMGLFLQACPVLTAGMSNGFVTSPVWIVLEGTAEVARSSWSTFYGVDAVTQQNSDTAAEVPIGDLYSYWMFYDRGKSLPWDWVIERAHHCAFRSVWYTLDVS